MQNVIAKGLETCGLVQFLINHYEAAKLDFETPAKSAVWRDCQDGSRVAVK